MSISAKEVKALRDSSGAGMMDCKKALVENDGNFEAALVWLQKKSIIKSEKKSSRVAAEGLVHIWQNEAGTSATIIEINCETDFVSRNDDFVSFVNGLANAIGESGISSLDQLDQVTIGGKSISSVITDKISTIGENIQLRRLARLDATNGSVGCYIHAGGQIGVLTQVTGDNADAARDVSMHAAAMKPAYLSPDDVSPEAAAQQEEIFTARLKEEGKPDHIVPRILLGQMKKWRNEYSLLAQPFVKNPDLSVSQFQKEAGVTIDAFVRFEVGEGIERVSVNLADEVAAALKG